jgi:SAM-dependent methyltransferase
VPARPPDPFAKFKAAQRVAWSSFAPFETFTAIPAAKLVKFAQISAGQSVLDVACGTGVVAVTAACLGAKAAGLDLSPALIERAHYNATVAQVDVDFLEGDVEAMPYPDASFDVVLSQYGHMFAPRPSIAIQEMLRVLKVGGRIAFSTWPTELFTAQQFPFFARYLPPPSHGADVAAPPHLWGDPNIIRERFGRTVTNILFEWDTMIVPSLSVQHFRRWQEATIRPLGEIVDVLQNDPSKLAQMRAEYEMMIREVFEDNAIHMHFIMTRATKV